MIADPTARGRALAAFFLATAPRLFRDLDESGALPAADREAAREEWESFALYACVRGLVAAGGFNRETAGAIEGLHAAVVESWSGAGAALAERRAQLAERYAEYGAIGQEHGASGADTVTERLGRAAARHLSPDPGDALAEIAGQLHEALAEAAAEAVREAT